MRQAQALAVSLAAVRFDAVYSSDLARSRETAEIVAGAPGPAVTTDSRLREIDTGRWEGLTREEASKAFPGEFVEREADVLGLPFPGGESFPQLRERVLAALEDILACRYTTALVVAHLGVNRVLLAHLLRMPFEELFSIRQDYCDFAVVDVPPGSTQGPSS